MKRVFVLLLISAGLFTISCGDQGSTTHEIFDDTMAVASPADNAGGKGQSGPMVMDTTGAAADTTAGSDIGSKR